FRIASMTKPMAAVGALTLVDDFALRLDDPVDGLLPELANLRVLVDGRCPIGGDTVPAHRPITAWDLATFNPGWGMEFDAPVPRSGERFLYDAADGQWAKPSAFPSAAGGLVSTVDDVLAFGRMLLAGGVTPDGSRLVSRAAVEAMTTDQINAASGASGPSP